MLEKLNLIRTPNQNNILKNKIINTIIIFILGVVLGIIAKWLDNLAVDNSIWWQQIIGRLNLNNVLSELGIWLCLAIGISVYSKSPLRAALNVFSFFVGMTVSYHLYTIAFSGFNPNSYMMIWYGLTMISPVLAFICWYSKGDHIVSIIISSLIISVMINMCFSVGFTYFYFRSVIDTLIFIICIFILYKQPKNLLLSLFSGMIISLIISNFIYL